MNASPYFSFPQRWTAQDLADAVPQRLRLRLSQMIDFDAFRDGGGTASANAPSRQSHPRLMGGYLRIAGLSRFFSIR